jgi:hypothetical protein
VCQIYEEKEKGQRKIPAVMVTRVEIASGAGGWAAARKKKIKECAGQ